jgi:hypothetical protein
MDFWEQVKRAREATEEARRVRKEAEEVSEEKRILLEHAKFTQARPVPCQTVRTRVFWPVDTPEEAKVKYAERNSV